MTFVTQLVLLAIFAASGWGLGDLLLNGNWIARIAGALAGLAAGFAVRDMLREKLGALREDDARVDEVREPPEPER